MTNLTHVAADIDEIVDRLGDVGDTFKGSRICLSGAAGFLGRHLVAALKRLGAKGIVALDNMVTASDLGEAFVWSLNGDRVVQFVKCDVSEKTLPDGFWTPDFVIHAAALTSPYWYRKHPLQTLDASIAGTRNMLELAWKSRRSVPTRFLLTSTSEIYGDPPDAFVPTPETFRGNVDTLGARSVYDEGKRLAETLCYAYRSAYGVDSVIVRIFNAYGPGMAETDYRATPNFAAKLKAGKPLQVYQTGKQTRTFSYVTDIVVGILQALAKGKSGEAYNLGSPGPEITILDLAERMGELAARKPVIEIVPHPESYPGDEPQRRCPSIEKARNHFGFNPVVPLDEGLRRFLRWSEENYGRR